MIEYLHANMWSFWLAIFTYLKGTLINIQTIQVYDEITANQILHSNNKKKPQNFIHHDNH